MINDFLSTINEDIVTKLGIHNYRIEEDCELIETENDKYPVVRNENGFQRISLDDDFEYVLYHRVINEDRAQDDEKSFGTKITYRNTLNVRLVISAKIHIGKDFVRDVKDVFPYKVNINVSPASDAFIEVGEINFNHDVNVVEEFGEVNYGEVKDSWLVSILNYSIITFETCK